MADANAKSFLQLFKFIRKNFSEKGFFYLFIVKGAAALFKNFKLKGLCFGL